MMASAETSPLTPRSNHAPLMLKQLGICVSEILTLIATLWGSFVRPRGHSFIANVLAGRLPKLVDALKGLNLLN